MVDGFGENAILDKPLVADADLSVQIEQAVKRDLHDRVKCVRVFDNYYRCNWWAQPADVIATKHASVWGDVAMQRVRKSRFLNVRVVDGKLVMKEMAARC